jgi:hypothetical protein
MFRPREAELLKLQDQLDRERQLLERARKQEEAAHETPAPKFCMTELYAIIPGCDCAPMRIDTYR